MEHRHGSGEFGFKLPQRNQSQAVSKPLRQMKQRSVFKHTYVLQEVLSRELQSLRVHKIWICHLITSSDPHHSASGVVMKNRHHSWLFNLCLVETGRYRGAWRESPSRTTLGEREISFLSLSKYPNTSSTEVSMQ
jgi:hypothetical protein